MRTAGGSTLEQRSFPSHRPTHEGQVGGSGCVDPLDDALEAARAGDEHAFAVLWRALHPPLLRYLLVRGNESPEDIAAETWLHVVRDLGGFTGGAAQFRAWLFTVARHRAVDVGRSRTARPAVPVAEPHELLSVGPAATAPSAEDAVADREATAAALRLVAALPPDQAEMVMLRVVAGLDVAAVASMVGKSPGAVRVAVHRALRTLSRDYEQMTKTTDPSTDQDMNETTETGGAR